MHFGAFLPNTLRALCACVCHAWSWDAPFYNQLVEARKHENTADTMVLMLLAMRQIVPEHAIFNKCILDIHFTWHEPN